MTLVKIKQSRFSMYITVIKGFSPAVDFPISCIYKELFGEMTAGVKKSTIFHDTISTAYTSDVIRGY
jgi:hypothetical protein